MGRYINVDSKGNMLPTQRKAAALMQDGAIQIPSDNVEFQPNLVCVVENSYFDAAAYAYSESEMNEFKRPDGRHKTWLRYIHAERLAE